MNELSVTVTVGIGSEKHNHDLEYRETLEHVHGRENGVIEIIPYRDYQEQINEAMKPFIDEYNQKQQARYQAAWERYNSGEIKTKPRKRNYQPMGYDYYSDHLNDQVRNPRTGKVEEQPIWRSMIIGIGDQADRKAGRITEDQAKRILKKTVDQFRKDFPNFLLLGASLHLDEAGFYHAHLDYKPLYKKPEPEGSHGLTVGIGQDAALEAMGFKPEQSIINGRDKVPILFNAMRNLIYQRVEAAMADEGLRLQYGVTATKEPGKDSSINNPLGNWQQTQDATRELQHRKNVILDVIAQDFVSDNDLKLVVDISNDIFTALEDIENSPKSRLDKNKQVVEFHLLDQLKSFVNDLLAVIGKLFRERDDYREKYEKLHENAKFGRWISNFDLQILEKSTRQRIAEAEQKTERLEIYLRKAGLSQKQIDEIKNRPEKVGSWGGGDSD